MRNRLPGEQVLTRHRATRHECYISLKNSASEKRGLSLHPICRDQQPEKLMSSEQKNKPQVLFSFCQLDKTRVTWEERTSIEKLTPADWPVGVSGNYLD